MYRDRNRFTERENKPEERKTKDERAFMGNSRFAIFYPKKRTFSIHEALHIFSLGLGFHDSSSLLPVCYVQESETFSFSFCPGGRREKRKRQEEGNIVAKIQFLCVAVSGIII
jgi:hypothetical protein